MEELPLNSTSSSAHPSAFVNQKGEVMMEGMTEAPPGSYEYQHFSAHPASAVGSGCLLHLELELPCIWSELGR